MSKLKGKHGNCSVVGCKDQHRSLHRPPASEDRRAEWLKFIFDGNIPATLCKSLYVCANHFCSDCFTNLGQYKAGLATKLCLKEGSVPTTRGRAAEEGHEALGETMGGDGDGGSARLCPLCQQAQSDRDALSLHLTEKHSVLPSCVEKLLDIAPPAQRSEDEGGENSSQNKINGKSLENTKSPSVASQDEGDSCSQDGSTQDKEMCDETEADWAGTESDQENVAQAEAVAEASVSGEISSDGSCANRPFKCHACLEFFPTRSALSVHYNSTSHIQRMRSGAASDKDPSGPARPYVSNKPYQCAVCRVSYNHAITLESHLKSVLHQSRSRSAGNATANPTTKAGNLGNTSATSNGAAQPSATASQPPQGTTKDNEQVPGQPASPLLSSPVASAQAVSAFLTLLTSSPNSGPHSILPYLSTTGAGPAPAATPAQIISQPQMLMPLILNGLQAQNPSSESPKQVLPQAVPVLGLNAAQQALLAQGLSGLQNQWAAFRLSNTSQATSDESAPDKETKNKIKQEPCDQQESETTEEGEAGENGITKCVLLKRENNAESPDDQDESAETDGKGSAEAGSLEESGSQSSEDLSECPSRSHKNNTESKTSPAKGPNTNKSAKTVTRLSSGPPVLTEFQSQVLWAFFESRNEADSASPPREDCEALGREVGLTEEEVRTWLLEARRARDRRIAEETDDYDEGEESIEDEEGALMIDEGEYVDSPSATSSHAMDLSSSAERGPDRPFNQELCLTSDSENEEFYTSVIVTDEESQSSSMKEEQPASPAKPAVQVETSAEKSSGGGKVLRSTTVFLSDAEDDDDDQTAKRKKRKRETEKDESECKKERPDADLDVQLEAQADPPTPLSVTLDPQGLPAGILHPLPLSLSLAPFSTQLFSPYVLSVPSSVVGVGVSEADRAKVATFAGPAAVTRTQQTAQILSNGNDCDSVLDLSMGKNPATSTPASSATSKSFIQKTALLDGLGLRPTTVGVPADGSLIVVQVKPDAAIALPKVGGTLANCNNLAKASAVYMRAAEKVNASLMARERESEQDKARDSKRPNARRFRDMRRSRTIIQADQLDILYGCYFKDPNPGKHEFEQISEWVQLPKKVVQIWFQNMRARERKGEVRFISDGTLAAVGKPLIKFTWPLKKPIFSSIPNANSNPSAPAWVPSKPQLGTDPPKVTQKIPEVKEPLKIPIQGLTRPKEVAGSVAGGTSAQKTKVEAVNAYTMVKIAPKTVAPLVPVPILTSASMVPQIAQKTNAEEQTESDDKDQEKGGSGTASRMVPKLSATPINKSPAVVTQKHNGITYWSQKGPIKINTLSREQLGLSTPRPIVTSASLVTSTVAVSTPPSGQSQKEPGYIQQHSTPRRPRTHLNCLQLSILQSCYETCAHPNALECEAVGTELGLPLKVVQIWFQNTRAKEKRWRLQQEKLSPNSSDPSKKVDISSGTYLQYNALRANRPILPKPVQLTVLETPAPSPVGGQPATRETLRGKCEVCGVEFESRAAARDHVFAPAHLAKLRTSNFGQAATQLNNGSAMASASVSPAGGTS